MINKKKLQRENGIAGRMAIDAQQRAEMDAAICTVVVGTPFFRDANIILSYQDFRGEVSLSACDAAARGLGKTVLYPYCLGAGEMLALLPEDEGAWITGKYGIRTPNPARAAVITPERIDLVLVPCTAFDAEGNRIGMGGGYYDRFLPRCMHAHKIMIAYEAQRVDTVEHEIHDVSMQLTITENHVYSNFKAGLI
ncbi:MAG: 5-formyltetrahydrofolate cyclo-ligase [Clostridia bacterium]